MNPLEWARTHWITWNDTPYTSLTTACDVCGATASASSRGRELSQPGQAFLDDFTRHHQQHCGTPQPRD